MELNGWASPQMLRRYGASARMLSGAQDSFGLACSRRLPFRWGASARRPDGRRHLADDRPGLP